MILQTPVASRKFRFRSPASTASSPVGRTTANSGYQTTQGIGDRVEEILCWIKIVGGLPLLWTGSNAAQDYFVAGAYNLLGMARLAPQKIT